MKKNRIMILGAGEFQVPIIKKCIDLGIESYVVDYNLEAEGFKYATKKIVESTNDKERVLEAFIKYKCDSIVTTSDYPVRTVAYVCEKQKVVGPCLEAAIISTDKYLLREKLKENDLPYPIYYRLEKKEDIINLVNKLNFPVIIKPVDSSASRGVTKINNLEELDYYYDKSLSYSNSGNIIIEEYIEGKEFSVECLIQNKEVNIIAITEKIVDGYPFFVESRHKIPADIDLTEKNIIEETVKKAIRAISLDNSAAHVELKLKDSKAYIIEIGPRLGGDYITSDLVPLATNIDMLKNIIFISQGRKIDINNRINNYSAIQFINKNNYKNYKENEEFILSNNMLVNYEFNENNISNKLESSFDRFGYIILKSNNKEDIDNILELFN